MSIQIKNDHINGTNPFNILDFNITNTGIEGVFTGSNCAPVKQTKSTYLIQDCTTIDCTTIQCNTVQCTTVNCTTINCTTINCNTVQCSAHNSTLCGNSNLCTSVCKHATQKNCHFSQCDCNDGNCNDND